MWLFLQSDALKNGDIQPKLDDVDSKHLEIDIVLVLIIVSIVMISSNSRFNS